MAQDYYNELMALIAVAEERSFTRAAARLGMSQSMISHTVKLLEERLGVRLLTRTTRSVSMTEAGERLLKGVRSRLDGIEVELRRVVEGGAAPTGTVRIAASDHAARVALWPRLNGVMAVHAGLKADVIVAHAGIDFNRDRLDFAIRLGGDSGSDVIAHKIGSDFRCVMVASPRYLSESGAPMAPQDLGNHATVVVQTAGDSTAPAWDLERADQKVLTPLQPRLTAPGVYLALDAVLDGAGIGYLPEDVARPHLVKGALAPVLEPWWKSFLGYEAYFPKRRHVSKAMDVVIDALRRFPS